MPLNINFNPTDVNQMTPLHWACKEGKIEAVQLLVSNVSIDVNCPDNEGKTPLHLACQNGNSEVVKLLLKEAGINVDATDQNGMTPTSIYCWLLILARKLLLSEWIWVIFSGKKIYISARRYSNWWSSFKEK